MRSERRRFGAGGGRMISKGGGGGKKKGRFITKGPIGGNIPGKKRERDGVLDQVRDRRRRKGEWPSTRPTTKRGRGEGIQALARGKHRKRTAKKEGKRKVPHLGGKREKKKEVRSNFLLRRRINSEIPFLSHGKERGEKCTIPL